MGKDTTDTRRNLARAAPATQEILRTVLRRLSSAVRHCYPRAAFWCSLPADGKAEPQMMNNNGDQLRPTILSGAQPKAELGDGAIAGENLLKKTRLSTFSVQR